MPIAEPFDGSRLHLSAPQEARDRQEPQPLSDSLGDAEILLAYAAESGTSVAPEITSAILNARAACRTDGRPDIGVLTAFQDAYAKLANQLGEVTACTIRSCASMKTRRTLGRHYAAAMLITILIATVSVATFIADAMSNGIVEDTTVGNDDATKLRAALTPLGGKKSLDPVYVQKNPCDLLTTPPSNTAMTPAANPANIEALQHFAITIRNLHGRALKLNWLIRRLDMRECDPLGPCDGPDHMVPTEAQARAQTQIDPAIINYDAEVLCKIQTFQTIRLFAANVRSDYLAVMGAIAAYALPIAYAGLGAYAFLLRSFSETIRKRTYHPSFSDSARMITAIIAGAIVGLFKPAQGLALSPLAIAFLAGYGVELFFKFLDTLINAFGSAGARSSAEARRISR